MPNSVPARDRRGFRIFRTPAGVQFSPPRDSDALFDALRAAYPEGKSHFERVLSAVGDFVRDEGRDSVITESPDLPNREPANDLDKSMKPLERNEDAREHGEKIRGLGAKRSGSSVKEGAFKSMTNVWSTETGRRYQYRPRRPMTEEERMEYRSKRAVGVCAPCKKKKRKVRSSTFL
jgi:hypothetical protein